MVETNSELKLKGFKRNVLIASITASILMGGLGFGVGYTISNKNSIKISKDMANFLKYYEKFKNSYYIEQDERDLIDGLYYGLTSSVDDDFTFYVSSKNNESQGLETSSVGIGYERTVYYGNALITHVMSNSPASKAKFINDANEETDEVGLKQGDIIIKIKELDKLSDYYVLKEHPSSEWNDYLNGGLGSNAELVILRDGIEKRCHVTRGRFDTDKVYLIDKNYGVDKKEAVVKVKTFLGNVSYNESTPARDMIDLFKTDLFKDNDYIDNLILDLRGNGGGYVVNFSELLSLFTGKLDAYGYYYYPNTGKYSKIEAPSEVGTNSIYNYDGWKNYNSQIGKYTILIDNNTASAAESFVLGMRDYDTTKDKVYIVGETSYGKGIAQSFLYPYSNDYDYVSSIRYTSAQVVSMKKNSINKRGIVPDKMIDIKYRSIQNEADYNLYRKEILSSSSLEDKMTILLRIEILLGRDFNGSLEEAIRAFQRKYSLEETGIYVEKTAKKLNDLFYDYYQDHVPHNIYNLTILGNDDVDSFSPAQRRIVKKQIELLLDESFNNFESACNAFKNKYVSELGVQEGPFNLQTSYFLQGKMYEYKLNMDKDIMDHLGD